MRASENKIYHVTREFTADSMKHKARARRLLFNVNFIRGGHVRLVRSFVRRFVYSRRRQKLHPARDPGVNGNTSPILPKAD